MTKATDTAAQASTSPDGAGDGAGVSGDLRFAILSANAVGGSNNIVFSGVSTIVLSGPLPPIKSNLTIDGGTLGLVTIDGAGKYRIFFADSGTSVLKNLQIQNGYAHGGAAAGGGGGGAGFGGALFVNQLASVTLINDYFFNNSAVGGAGGNQSLTIGGGGGMGFPGAASSSSVYGGGGGGLQGPGTAQNGGPGGGGGGGVSSGTSTGGSAYAADANQNAAGKGSSHIEGGAGGFGGGGGGGFTTSNITGGGDGGIGGFGGGGGAGGFGGRGGAGGAGGGGAAAAAGGALGAVAGGAGFGACGGGGAAAGPVAFVRGGGTLTVNNSGQSQSSVTPGAAGCTSQGSQGQIAGSSPGTADASPIFPSTISILGTAPLHYLVTVSPTSLAGVSFAVQVTAQYYFSNATATTYTGTVHFTSSDAAAILPANATLTNGVGTFLVTLATTGTQTITVTDTAMSGLSQAASVLVQANPATHFQVTTPSSTVAGTPFSITVTQLDASSHTLTSFSGGVRLTSSDTSATLPSNISLSSGTGTFTVTLSTSGSQTITATDTATGTVAGTSNSVAVSAASATHFAVNAPANTTAGSALTFTVTALDAFNNVATGYTGLVHSTSTDSNAALQGNSSLVAGVGTFSATLKTAGNQTITATDAGNGSITGTSGGITVNIATLRRFLVSTPPTTIFGVPFNVTVSAVDAFDNVISGYNGTVYLTSSDSAAGLGSGQALSSGSGVFSVTARTLGTQTVTATDPVAVLTGLSASFTVTHGPATHFSVSAPGISAAGSAFAITITALDQFNNRVTDYNGTVHLTSSDGAAVLSPDAALVSGQSAPLVPAAGSPPSVIQPFFVAAADLDGDGNLDLIITSPDHQTVTIFMGNGAGQFTPGPNINIPAGDAPYEVAAVDFNGDGKLDLAITETNTNQVLVYLYTAPATYTLTYTIPAIAVPRALAVGDFNGDGRPDIAVANTDSFTVQIFLWNGAGFTEASNPISVENFPDNLITADLNGDGKLDLAVVNYRGDSISILLGDGKGGFMPGPNSPVRVAAGTYPYTVAVADFNKDGHPDLAIVGFSTNDVTVLLGSASGAFTPSPGGPIPVGAAPIYVTTGDFNGDGLPDIATANYANDNITLLLNNGAGGFTPYTIAAGVTPTGILEMPINGVPGLVVVNYNSGNLTVLTAPFFATLKTTGTQTITATDLATNALTGTATIVVPTPVTLTSISTVSATVGASGFFLSVTGSGFQNGATVLWNGTPLNTTFSNSTTLVAFVDSGQLLTAGAYPVTVLNPVTNPGTSNAINLTVNNVAPVINGLSIASAPSGSGPILITVAGSGFVNGATAAVGGSPRVTSFGNAGTVAFTLTTSDLSAPATLAITVANPTPGGGASNALAFTVTGSGTVPTLTSFSPGTVAAGSSAFTLTVYGSNFSPLSQVLWNNAARQTTFLTSQQITATIVAGDVLSAGPVPIAVNNPGAGTSAPMTFTIGSAPQGSVAPALSTNGAPALTVSIPIVLTLNNGATLGAFNVGVSVTPGVGAPPLTASLSFQNAAALPAGAPQIASSTSAIGVFWGSFTTPLSGTVTLGTVQVPIPATAAVGQTYAIQITGAGGASGNAAIPINAGANGTVAIVQSYVVGDVVTKTGDSAGAFGDGQINTLDLLEVLRMVTGILSPAPKSCSDRFDAMDVFPVDTATSRGGDGIVNTVDLLSVLRKATNIDTARPVRIPRGGACTDVAPVSKLVGQIEGAIEIEGNAIYLRAAHDLKLGGLAISLRLPEGVDASYTYGTHAASIVDRGQPGLIALAWLDELTAPAGERILLGYVEAADRSVVVGISSHAAGGRSVRLDPPRRR